MSKGTYTRGPWTLETNGGWRPIISARGGYITREICRPDGSTMAAFHRQGNAVLIAAAPEMHDLLVKLRNAVEALDGTSVENECLVDTYRALMARLPEPSTTASYEFEA